MQGQSSALKIGGWEVSFGGLEDIRMRRILVISAVVLVAVMGTVEGSWLSVISPGYPIFPEHTYCNGIDGDDVVGYFSFDGVAYSFLYNKQSGEWYTFEFLDKAFGIDCGKIVGCWTDGCFYYGGFDVWFFYYPGSISTTAYDFDGIHNVGHYKDGSGNYHGYIYDGLDDWRTLDFPGATYTSAWGIDGHRIVGNYKDTDGNRHGFLYNGTNWITLDFPEATSTWAYGVDGGNIVGQYTDAWGNNHGFLYNGTSWKGFDFPGAESTKAMGIDGDFIVGSYRTTSGRWCGYICTTSDIEGAKLAVSSTFFFFIASEGGANPTEQVLSIRNIGSVAMNWEISEACNWLTVDPKSGTCIYEANDVNLNIDISGLVSGKYNCQITVTADGAKDSPQIIDVELIICADCTLPGSGTPEDPYQIWDANHMQAIGAVANYWDKHFLLCADIDLSGFTRTSFNIIGTDYDLSFTGFFDGNGHTISNLTYTSVDESYIGLFGYVDGGEIKNLGLINPNIGAGTGWNVGSLVGYLKDGTITNCCVEGGSVSGDEYVGGLVGSNYGTIANCSSNGSVSGDNQVGGLVGYNYDYSTITNSYSTCIVSGDRYVGGLLGSNSRSIIYNCYSTGSVSGTTTVGGLVGWNRYGTIKNCFSSVSVLGDSGVGGLVGSDFGGSITNCYSTGSVSGNVYVGGLEGYNRGTITKCYSTGSVAGGGGLVGSNGGKISFCYWDIETSGQTTSAGGVGLTTTEMQMAITFVCWAYEAVWTIDEGVDYPRLWWENKPGELITIYSYGGGSGELDDPYLIYTAEQFNKIGLFPCHLDKHFKLMADIDLIGYAGTSFNIIGNYEYPFTGVFDGNDNTISNFTYDSNNINYIGLFGGVGVGGVIKNLGLIEPNVCAGNGNYVGSLVADNYGTIANCHVEGGSVTGGDNVGGLVGDNPSGTITNCYAKGGSISGMVRVGGLVGRNSGTIINSCSTGSVSAGWDVGGLVGFNNRGKITNSYSIGSVSGDSEVGGLVGRQIFGTISNCYSTVSVSGDDNIGGLVGFDFQGSITNCYATGSVSGNKWIGGLVGYTNLGEVLASFWDIETSGQDTSDGGTGLPTEEMQMQVTFTDAGWDFDTPVWTIYDGVDYPRLWWEGMKVPMKLTPRTLNCRSKGDWVKAHLTLPEGFTVSDVDSNRPAVLHSYGFQSAPLYVFVNRDKLVEIEAAFEREQVCSLVGNWPEELIVAGFLSDGNIFLGTSTVRIIHPGMKVIEDLAWYWLNADCVHPDFCDGIDMNRDSLVNLLDYALLLNTQVEFVTDE